jgi:hypothetical protein
MSVVGVSSTASVFAPKLAAVLAEPTATATVCCRAGNSAGTGELFLSCGRPDIYFLPFLFGVIFFLLAGGLLETL